MPKQAKSRFYEKKVLYLGQLVFDHTKMDTVISKCDKEVAKAKAEAKANAGFVLPDIFDDFQKAMTDLWNFLMKNAEEYGFDPNQVNPSNNLTWNSHKNVPSQNQNTQQQPTQNQPAMPPQDRTPVRSSTDLERQQNTNFVDISDDANDDANEQIQSNNARVTAPEANATEIEKDAQIIILKEKIAFQQKFTHKYWEKTKDLTIQNLALERKVSGLERKVSGLEKDVRIHMEDKEIYSTANFRLNKVYRENKKDLNSLQEKDKEIHEEIQEIIKMIKPKNDSQKKKLDKIHELLNKKKKLNSAIVQRRREYLNDTQ